jgi:hypothetical protein
VSHLLVIKCLVLNDLYDPAQVCNLFSNQEFRLLPVLSFGKSGPHETAIKRLGISIIY